MKVISFLQLNQTMPISIIKSLVCLKYIQLSNSISLSNYTHLFGVCKLKVSHAINYCKNEKN